MNGQFPFASSDILSGGFSPSAFGGGGGSVPTLLEYQGLYPLAMASTVFDPNQGAPFDQGNFWAAAFVSNTGTIVENLVCLLTQGNYQQPDMRVMMGIYEVSDLDGLAHQIAAGSAVGPAEGYVVVPIGAPVTLQGGKPYYLGFWTNMAAARVAVRTDGITGIPNTFSSPGISVPNAVNLPTAFNPRTNQTGVRVWIGAGK